MDPLWRTRFRATLYQRPIDTQARKSVITRPKTSADRDPFDGRSGGHWRLTSANHDKHGKRPAERDEGHRPQEHVGQARGDAGS